LQNFGASAVQHCETLRAQVAARPQHYATFLDTSRDSDERMHSSNEAVLVSVMLERRSADGPAVRCQ
jgi:hypothetical protein